MTGTDLFCEGASRRSRRDLRPDELRGWAAQRVRRGVEREAQVPEVHGPTEERAGAASLRGQMTIAELCREHEISETLLRRWREQFLAAGAERLSGKAERTEADELRRQVRQLERALGRKTLEVEVAGELLRGWE